jgi:O-antigen/teichoic acid export membrane protein
VVVAAAGNCGQAGGVAQENDDYTRDESEAHRIDRNYNEMLQELRVAQTGVQILFAFLLGIAFQQRFATVNGFERVTYVVTLTCAAAAAILLIAPVAVHRVLFRQHRKEDLIELTGRLTGAGLVSLALAMISAVLLVATFAANLTAGVIIAAALAALLVLAWWVWPSRHQGPVTERGADPGADRGAAP